MPTPLVSTEEFTILRESVSALEHADLAQAGRARFEAVLDKISALRHTVSKEDAAVLSNLRKTTVRLLLRRLPTIDRTDEGECIAVFQILWFRLLPQVIEEAKRDPELLRVFNQFRASNATFRSPLFDPLGKSAEKYARMAKRDV